jgi:hypothetical protein
LLASFSRPTLDLIQEKICFQSRGQPRLSVSGLGGLGLQTDFTVLRAKLAAAYGKRKITRDPRSQAAVALHFAGLRSLDIYQLAAIADQLNVSVDWLLGRSDLMELPREKAQ